MSRLSNDVYKNGRLWNGFDYSNQAWVGQATFESDLREFADGKPGAPSYVSSQPSLRFDTLRGWHSVDGGVSR